jgi:hypothetical protein
MYQHSNSSVILDPLQRPYLGAHKVARTVLKAPSNGRSAGCTLSVSATVGKRRRGDILADEFSCTSRLDRFYYSLRS